MNPLLNNQGNGGMGPNNGPGLPPQLRQNIQNVKGLMQMMRQTPAQMIQQNPMVSQLTQLANLLKGQNTEAIFMNMCQSSGVDPNAILRELQQ